MKDIKIEITDKSIDTLAIVALIGLIFGFTAKMYKNI